MRLILHNVIPQHNILFQLQICIWGDSINLVKYLKKCQLSFLFLEGNKKYIPPVTCFISENQCNILSFAALLHFFKSQPTYKIITSVIILKPNTNSETCPNPFKVTPFNLLNQLIMPHLSDGSMVSPPQVRYD